MAAVDDILAKIDTNIDLILDDYDSIADYKIGQKSVARHQVLDTLLKARDKYQELAEKEPYESIDHVAMDITEFGEDISELIGDDTS